MPERKRNSCPKCGSIRVKGRTDKRKSHRYYICDNCRWTGEVVKKIIWFSDISYKGGGPHIGRNRANNVRERSFCPKCKSVRIRKRVITHDYFCECCGNICTNPKKMKWGSQAC